MKKLFKVIDNDITKSVLVDTKNQNYSLTLTKTDDLQDFLDIVVLVSSNCKIPISVLVSLNNGIAMFGHAYLQQLPYSKNGLFTANQITKKDSDNQFIIKESDLNYFIDSVNKVGFKMPFEGFYIWEHIFEKARQSFDIELPKRSESFFLFESIADCEKYIRKYKLNGKICQVDIIETNKLFRADMNILNEIPNNFDSNQVFEHALNYWNGKTSTQPFYEIIFQGKCELIPL